MTPEQIRAAALHEAVTLGVSWRMEAAGDILALAVVFECYVTQGSAGTRIPQPPADDPSQTRDDVHAAAVRVSETLASLKDQAPEIVQHIGTDIWGGPCARPGCGHSQGFHTAASGCTMTQLLTLGHCGCDAFVKPNAHPEPASETPNAHPDPCTWDHCGCDASETPGAHPDPCTCGHVDYLHGDAGCAVSLGPGVICACLWNGSEVRS